MRTICFYHGTDFDGKCSAAIVKMHHSECELLPLDHGIAFPWYKLNGQTNGYMVDYTLKPFTDMLRLREYYASGRFVWIEHHPVVNEVDAKINRLFAGIRDTSIAACELTWRFLYPDKPMPRAVRLIGEYDSWRFPQDDPEAEALLFQYGMRQWEGDPANQDFWQRLFVASDKKIDEIIRSGRPIWRYAQQRNKKFVENGAFVIDFCGYRCLALNIQFGNSHVFASVWDPEKYDAMLAFAWRNNCWFVTMYTDKPGVNVRAVAQRFGGDGHVKSAGFQCQELPFAPGGG